MGEALKYATAFALRKAWAAWDAGEKALMLNITGLTIQDVMSVQLQMLQLKDLPSYRRIDKTAVREHLEAQLRDHIAEEA